jgi:hypothetical protein
MITDISLRHLIETHPKLERLSLMWIYRFSGDFIQDLVVTCQSLRSLQFMNCTQLTDVMLTQLGVLPNLQHFSLEGSLEVSSDGFMSALTGTKLVYKTNDNSNR